MSKESITQFANGLLTDAVGQRDLQNAVNEFASSLVDAGQKRGFEFTIEELGAFLSQTFFPDGSTPETRADDRREWAPALEQALGNLRVSNPDHKMFQTMSFDSVDNDVRELMEQAAQSQAAAPAKAATPAAAEVDAFEPEDSYFDKSTAQLTEIEEARRRLQAEESGANKEKPFWKVW